MCDEREQLIGYVYDECDAGERRRVEAHLAECESCRDEISGLRGVRTDLLAWEVPDHGSVWTPFVRARLPWYREVPAWAMAAAASVMFLVGAAGGVVTHAFVVGEPVAQTAGRSAAPAPGAVAVPAAISASELTAMEQRVVRTMRSELDSRMQLVSMHSTPARTADAGVSDAELRRIVAELVLSSEDHFDEQLKAVRGELYSQIRSKGYTDQRITNLEKAMQTMTNPSQPGGNK